MAYLAILGELGTFVAQVTPKTLCLHRAFLLIGAAFLLKGYGVSGAHTPWKE